VSTIVVEHRDRLAPFGVEHLEAALAATGRRIIVVNPDEVEDDLARDMTEVAGVDVCSPVWSPVCSSPR
jgi:putative resolvase